MGLEKQCKQNSELIKFDSKANISISTDKLEKGFVYIFYLKVSKRDKLA